MTWGPYETVLKPNPTGTIAKGEIAVNNPILKHFIDLDGHKDMVWPHGGGDHLSLRTKDVLRSSRGEYNGVFEMLWRSFLTVKRNQ